MIIVNGYIKVKGKTGGGLDPVTGYPTTPTATWGDPIQCQYVPSAQNLQAEADNEPVTLRRYAIFLEGYQSCEVYVDEQIALFDGCNHIIGEFSVRSVTPLLAVDETRLDV